MHKLVYQSIVALGLVASPRALAEADPKFEMGKQGDVKDVKDVEWTATGEAGLVATTGNSQTTTIAAGANVTRKDKDNKFEGVLAGTFARATTRVATDANGDGVIGEDELSSVTATSAENAALKLRYDRYLTELDSLYVAALGAVDRPAGKQFQGGGQVGYSRSLYKSEDHQALAELGYDLSYLRLTAGESTTIHSLRAFVGYKGKLKAETALEAALEGLFNANTVTFGDRKASAFQDTRLNGMVGITTSLSSKLSLSASFTAKFDNFPAPLAKIGDLPFAPGFEPLSDKLDTVTKVSLIIKFL
jgi:putative salt-induced outer membrane protein YdiY